MKELYRVLAADLILLELEASLEEQSLPQTAADQESFSSIIPAPGDVAAES